MLWARLPRFEQIDIDGSGTIDAEELALALSTLSDADASAESQNDDPVQQGDDTNDGFSPTSTTPSIFSNTRRPPHVLIRDLLKVADDDGDGQISREEYKRLRDEVEKLGLGACDEESDGEEGADDESK